MTNLGNYAGLTPTRARRGPGLEKAAQAGAAPTPMFNLGAQAQDRHRDQAQRLVREVGPGRGPSAMSPWGSCSKKASEPSLAAARQAAHAATTGPWWSLGAQLKDSDPDQARALALKKGAEAGNRSSARTALALTSKDSQPAQGAPRLEQAARGRGSTLCHAMDPREIDAADTPTGAGPPMVGGGGRGGQRTCHEQPRGPGRGQRPGPGPAPFREGRPVR